MEIVIKDIPAEGLDLHFESVSDPWFLEMLKDALVDSYQKKDNATAHFHILRAGDTVNCSGHLSLDSYPTCSRCSKVFRHHLNIPMHLTLAPLYENTRQLQMEQKEEVELVKEDLDFAFYDGASFNLGNMMREQIILGFPMQPLCQENCKGLCPHCGKDLNEQTCHCKPKSLDLRWAPLKALKKK